MPTIDPCPNCNAKNWDERISLVGESPHDRTMREHGERYAKMTPAERAALHPRSSRSRGGIGRLFVFAVVIGLLAFSPWVVQDGAVWLFPNSAFGYAMKYDVPEKNVYVLPKPHDCEWDKAPIGKKYCLFDVVVSTDKDQTGKVTTVYVNWQRVKE